MADKYIFNNAGNLKEKEGLVTSAGAGDAGKIVALDAAGKLDTTLMPTGVGPQTASIVSSENLSAGDLVNVWDDSGTPKVRKADATAVGKQADGFVLAGVTAPAAATVYFNGTLTGLAGMTGGARQYLSTTPGARTATAPSSAGNVVQYIGKAISSSAIAFNPLDPIELV